MSRSFDPDDPSSHAHDNRQSGYTTPNNYTAPPHEAGDYIEAEYVPDELADARHPAETHSGAHADGDSSHGSHSSVLSRIGRTLERAISAKDDYVVAVKVSAEAQSKLERLVQAGVFQTRAEAAAFLIDEGIEAQAPLFGRVDQKLAEIERLRAELRGLVNSNPEEGG